MLGIVGLYLLPYGVKMEGASWWGKIATAYFYFVVIVLVGLSVRKVAANILILSSCVFVVLAFVLYAYQLYGLNKYKPDQKVRKKK